MPSPSIPAPQGGNSADRACLPLRVSAEIFATSVRVFSHRSERSGGVGFPLTGASTPIAALGAQARDDLTDQITNSSRVIHAATDSYERQ